MKTYLDTSIVLFLAQPALDRITETALAHIADADLVISPMVLLELSYLFELGRIKASARDVQRKIEYEIGVRVCNHSFADIVEQAQQEMWTRDPFDRMIVAHAKAVALSLLVSADEKSANIICGPSGRPPSHSHIALIMRVWSELGRQHHYPRGADA